MTFKFIKVYAETHARLDDARKYDQRHMAHWEKSYNEMVRFLVDFYFDFHDDGGTVRRKDFVRKGERRTEITYPEVVK